MTWRPLRVADIALAPHAAGALGAGLAPGCSARADSSRSAGRARPSRTPATCASRVRAGSAGGSTSSECVSSHLLKILPVIAALLLTSVAWTADYSGCPEIAACRHCRDRPMSRYETAGRPSCSNWQERCRGGRRRLPEANVWEVWLTLRPFYANGRRRTPPHDDCRNPISGAVSRRGTADALRRRAVHAAAAGDDRKARARQQHDVNPDARAKARFAEIWRAVGSAQSVVCNFPIVAWKRVMFAPLLAMAIARLRRRKIVLIQHEWGGLHWLRRITYMPALLLADTIVMFSPLVQRELADDPLLGWTAKKSVLAPLPPNIEAPAGIEDFEIAASPRRRAGRRAAADRPFRIDLSGQAAQCAARDRRHPEATRAQAAARLYRLLHPRRRQGRGGVSCPRQQNSASPRM